MSATTIPHLTYSPALAAENNRLAAEVGRLENLLITLQAENTTWREDNQALRAGMQAMAAGDRSALNTELAAANSRLVQKLRSCSAVWEQERDAWRQERLRQTELLRRLNKQLVAAAGPGNDKEKDLAESNERLREAINRKIAEINALRTILQAGPGISLHDTAQQRMAELQELRAELAELSDSGPQALLDAMFPEDTPAAAEPAPQILDESCYPGIEQLQQQLERYIDQPAGQPAVAAIDDIHAAVFAGEPVLTEIQQAISDVCDGLRSMLIDKNRTYGNSALEPLRVFSKASPQEQILVRLDDKLSRLARGSDFPGDDTIMDLTGYLILLIVQRGQAEEAAR